MRAMRQHGYNLMWYGYIPPPKIVGSARKTPHARRLGVLRGVRRFTMRYAINAFNQPAAISTSLWMRP
jgi:hypothetical protein